MDELTLRGVIIRQANYGDAHRMLWILTEHNGIIKAVRYGIRGKKTSNAAAFQLFSYGDFKLRPSQGEVMTAVSADVLDGFYPLAEDIKKLALITYFADITHRILGEGNPDIRLLWLFLNGCYAAAYRDVDLRKLKAAYELKLMCLEGYRPRTNGCYECGEFGTYFSTDRGVILCRRHYSVGDMEIEKATVSAINYLCRCDVKKMLAFDVPDEKILNELNMVTERYVASRCEKEFDSLKYYYSLRDI